MIGQHQRLEIDKTHFCATNFFGQIRPLQDEWDLCDVDVCWCWPRPTQFALCSTDLTCIFLYVQHDLGRSKYEQYRFAFRKTDRVW
jgi:hypothetical protein